MPPKSFIRVAGAAAVCLLFALAAFAGTSAGSGSSPRATSPRLLAHDTSSFARSPRQVARRRSAKRSPQLLQAARTVLAQRSTRRATRVLLDATADSTVTNTSSDIGIAQFLVASNGNLSVYSRTVTIPLLGSVTNTSFWSGLGGPDAAGLCASNPQGQPSVAYDQVADRWVVAEAAYVGAGAGTPVGPFVECVAVSSSPDATGTWYRYAFQVSTSLYPERPTLAVWADGYYLSFNQHTAGGVWSGAGALALERSKMLAGTPAQARYFDLEGVTPGLGGMLPAGLSGTNPPVAGSPELYLQAHDNPSSTINDRLEIWGFHVDWTAPVTGSTFQPIVNLPLSPGFAIDTAFSCVQPGTSTLWSACLTQEPPSGQASTQQLEPLAQANATSSDALPQLGGRLQWGRSAGGDETLTATMTVNGGSNVSTPAWFKLSNIAGAGWSIANKAEYNPADGVSRFLPSAAFDNAGNVGLAFVKTDGGAGNLDPSTAYTNATDGTFGEVGLDTGSVPFTAGTTYGRYTTLSVDPVGNCAFWFSGPLPAVSFRGLPISIRSFSLPGCVAAAASPLLTSDPTWTAPLVREGLTITGHSGAFSNATSVTQQWRLCDSRGMNCVDIVGATGMTHVATAADAAGDRTLRFEEIATNANGTSTAVSTPSTIVQSIPPANQALPVISGTAQAGQVLSATQGTWQSSSPVSYTYRWRRCTNGTCANIGGANSASYTLTAADVGATVDVVVSATNTGGGTDANATATAVVAAAPVVAPPSSGGGGTTGGSGSSGSSGTSSGGSSGGGPGSPDLAVTGFAGTPSPAVGDNVTFVVTVTDKNAKPAQQLNLVVTLGSGLQFVSSVTDRGNPCSVSGANQLRCFLDWLSNDVTTAHLQITTKVIAATGQTFSATASAAQGELNPADNTLALTLNATPTQGTTTGTGTSTSGVPVGLNGDGTPTKKQDKKKPTATALASTGRRGRAAQLRFKVYDDHGVAKVLTTVKRNGETVGAASTGYGPVAFGSVYYLGWQVPARASKGNYSFCVVALDRAGNKSAQSCAPLAVR